MTPTIDVLLHLRASLDVTEEQAQPVRLRLQESLEQLVSDLESFGAVYEESEFYARPRVEGKEAQP